VNVLGNSELYASAGQGGFEIRTFILISATANGAPGTVHFYEPLPIFAVGCTIVTYDLALHSYGPS